MPWPNHEPCQGPFRWRAARDIINDKVLVQWFMVSAICLHHELRYQARQRLASLDYTLFTHLIFSSTRRAITQTLGKRLVELASNMHI